MDIKQISGNNIRYYKVHGGYSPLGFFMLNLNACFFLVIFFLYAFVLARYMS